MVYVMVILAILAGIGGGLSLSNATMGVGIICGGCLLAILGRIFQADRHHENVRALLEWQTSQLKAQLAAKPPDSPDRWNQPR